MLLTSRCTFFSFSLAHVLEKCDTSVQSHELSIRAESESFWNGLQLVQVHELGFAEETRFFGNVAKASFVWVTQLPHCAAVDSTAAS